LLDTPELIITLLRVLRALVEVAAFTLIGQGLLYFLAGASREQNFVYQLFRIITNPVTKAVRIITPRVIVDKHIGAVSFFLLLWLWLLLAMAKQHYCASQSLVCA